MHTRSDDSFTVSGVRAIRARAKTAADAAARTIGCSVDRSYLRGGVRWSEVE